MTQFLQWYRSLSADHKAGLFVWPSLAGSGLTDSEEALLKRFRPSGMVLFKRNLATPLSSHFLIVKLKQILGFSNSVFSGQQGALGPFPVIAVDEEGGRVSRLPFPDVRGKPALELGTQPQLLREQVARQIRYAKALGVTCILAPVADILTEPTNPVMGDRCFGRTSEDVVRAVIQVHEQLQNAGLFSCAKHFPGHGDTREDSHLGFAQSRASLPLLRLREWVPFRRLIQSGIPLVMTAHVLVPSVDPHRPATLSPLFLNHLLRNELGFDGLIVSDDMRMNAIKHYYTQPSLAPVEADIVQGAAVEGQSPLGDEAVVSGCLDALVAGCDIVLCCQSITRELPVLEALSRRLSTDPTFEQLCESKAKRIYEKMKAYGSRKIT